MKFPLIFIFLISLNSVLAAERPNILVIFTDDQGYADLGVQGSREDIVTPNIDALARSGVRCTAGYVTAPQCVPSRAGLISGIHQNRFGQETNRHGPMPLNIKTIGHHLQELGYTTGMSGKWHLAVCNYGPDQGKWQSSDPENPYLPAHRGFDEYCSGILQDYVASHDFEGNPIEGAPAKLHTELYRVHAQSDWAEHFIDRHAKSEAPFFLYVSLYAPHVPAVAPDDYMERFAHIEDPMRQVGLAMMATVDDGVGRILDRLEEHGIRENTLIFYISDNGAPGNNGWNGSLNDPLRGYKGNMTEGGLRVPYLVSWPAVLPEDKVFEKKVSSLDVVATSVSAAGGVPMENLDGVDLIPFLKGDAESSPHESLFWRWTFRVPNQSAIVGDWKYIKQGDGDPQLYNLRNDLREENDLSSEYPEVLKEIREKFETWYSEMPEVDNPWERN